MIIKLKIINVSFQTREKRKILKNRCKIFIKKYFFVFYVFLTTNDFLITVSLKTKLLPF